METTLPIDITALPPALSARLLAYCEDFCAPEDERHLWLAAHAAFPVVLTTDLLYKIWLNFRFDEQGQPLYLPMVAVSDLLLSTLCRPTSRQVYEMPQDIRTALLLYLKAQPRFGAARVQRLAHFLKFYLRENPRKLPSPAFAKAQEFTWLAQLDPQKAAEQLLDAWNRQKDKGRLRQMLAWSEQQAQLLGGEEGLGGHNPLSVAIQILRGIQHFQEGQRDKALQELQALKGRARKEQGEEGDGIRMDIPQAVLERLPGEFFGEKETDRKQEDRLVKYAKIHFLTSPAIDPKGLLNHLAGFEEEKEFRRPFNILSFERPIEQNGQHIHLSYSLWQWMADETSNALEPLLLTPNGIYVLYFPLVRDEAGHPDYTAFSHAVRRLRLRFEKPQIIGLFVNQGGSAESFDAAGLRAEFPDLAEVFFLEQEETGFPVLRERLDQLAIEQAEQDPGMNAAVARMAADLRNFPEIIFSKEFFWKRWEKVASSQQNPEHILAELRNTGRLIAAIPLTPQGAAGKAGEGEYIAMINYPAPFIGKLFQLFSPDGPLASGKGELSVPAFKSYWGFASMPGEPDQLFSLLEFHQLAFVSRPANTIVFPHALPRKPLEIEFNFTHHPSGHLIYRFAYLPSDLFPQLVASLGKWGKTGMRYSATQLYFEEEGTQVEGRLSEGENVVQFKCSGKGKDALLKEIRHRIDNAIRFSFPLLPLEPSVLHIPAHATPDMVSVEGGTFQMGSNEYDREKPIHEVRLDSFEIGRYPVTMQEYDAFCEATGREKVSDSGWGREKRPVIYVDWYDAIEYCNWLSGIWGLEEVYKIEKDKKDPNNKNSNDKKKWLVTPKRKANGYRLPSEAEWEYAARGGRQSKGYRYAGSNKLDEVGWYSENSDRKTHPVGLKKPNELGLYDMSGNVWEWCEDVWHGNYEKAPADGSAWLSGGDPVRRVLRGGSWGNDAGDSRLAGRSGSIDEDRDLDDGFRLARD